MVFKVFSDVAIKKKIYINFELRCVSMIEGHRDVTK